MLALLVLAMASPAAAAEGPARLLKDINQAPSYDLGSYPGEFHGLGAIALFRAHTHACGLELWKTDGTAEGTGMVKDINPGPYGGLDWRIDDYRVDFVEVNDVLVFPAGDTAHGVELWRSDGTEAGTYLLKDIRPGSDSPFTSIFSDETQALIWVNVVAGGLMYFLADDGAHGFELWRTDGTTAGTFLLLDIQPGWASAFGSHDSFSLEGAALGSSFCFRAANDVSGAELWTTDGTGAGTVLLKDFIPGSGSGFPSGMTELNGRLFLSATPILANYELWATDGTAAGTVLVTEITPGLAGSWPQNFTRVGTRIYFQSFQHLYRTDGTRTGTIRLTSFRAGASMEFHGGLNGNLLVRSDDGIHGMEPWISDGTPSGTRLLKDIRPGLFTYSMQDLLQVGGVAYFSADDGVHGVEVWRSDGTPEGTRMLADFTTGSDSTYVYSSVSCQGRVLLSTADRLIRIDPASGEFASVATVRWGAELFALGDRALFAHDDGEHGSELWNTDGTAEGTGLLKDLQPYRNGASYPFYLGNAIAPDGKVRALHSVYGDAGGLYASDGTRRGTGPIAAIVPLTYNVGFKEAGATLGGSVYFTATDGDHGYELWRSDGTSAGTRMVLDIGPAWGAVYSAPVAWRDRVFFVAEDATHGPELWSSDGTEAGTRMVGDFVPGPEGSYPSRLIVAGETLFLQMFGDHGWELWTSDGTQSGTRLVKDIVQASSGFCCTGMVPFNGKLLFQANDGIHGTEPWISDGTEAGTFLLRDIVEGRGSSSYRETAVIGDSVFFQINDGVHGIELWKSDGTTAGTVLVKDIRPGPESAFPSFLGPAGDALVFTTLDPQGRGWEVWRSDGTETGTFALGVFFPEDARAAGTFAGGVLFSETDFEGRGLELWRTDGTIGGTTFVQDIAPGSAWSDPREFVEVGSHILFVADDPVADRELFTGRTAILLGQPDRALSDLGNELRALGLPKGIETSLLAKLQPAENALARGRTIEAVVGIENFVRHVQAQTPRRIDAGEAADLVEFAQDLVTLLESAHAPSLPQPAARPRTPRQRLDP